MKKVLVLGAPSWCAACRAIDPMVKEMKNLYKEKVEIEIIDVDLSPEYLTTDKYHIQSLPSLIFRNGEDIVEIHKGPLTKSVMKQKLDSLIAAK